jgi:hypothetical protein
MRASEYNADGWMKGWNIIQLHADASSCSAAMKRKLAANDDWREKLSIRRAHFPAEGFLIAAADAARWRKLIIRNEKFKSGRWEEKSFHKY